MNKIQKYQSDIRKAEANLKKAVKELSKGAGERVRNLRKEDKMTQEELALACGLSRPQITNIEIGNCRMTIDTLLILCSVFNVTSDYILGIEE